MISSRDGADWSAIGPVSTQWARPPASTWHKGLISHPPDSPTIPFTSLPSHSVRVNTGSGPTFHSQVIGGNHRQTWQPHANCTHDTPNINPICTHTHAHFHLATQAPPSFPINLALISKMGMQVATCAWWGFGGEVCGGGGDTRYRNKGEMNSDT